MLLLLLAASCSNQQTLRGVFQKQTPYERYASSLKTARLDQTAIGQDWLESGQRALHDSITITLPFKETGYFAADVPRALVYRFEAKRGERVVINLDLKARESFQVFMDMYEATEDLNKEPKHVASADTASNTLSYEIEEDQQHILRLQPELLRSGQYTLTIKTEPTMAFPVQGKTSKNIASIWGDPRDNGARSHEGVDIFAKRGTPALAATDGIVTSVGNNGLGGKVVWLSDVNRNQNLYYAHLDKQLVSVGQRVTVGDTLGLIGNTGNARTTSPHLHFGIYRFGKGPTNPYPYLHASTAPTPRVKIDPEKVGTWVRVAGKEANIRLQPSTKYKAYKNLRRHTPLLVTGGTADWYRVRLPNGTEAYIADKQVEATSKPISYERLATATDLLDEAYPQAAPKESIAAGSNVAVLGIFNEFRLVRNSNGITGWVLLPTALSTR